ncbi:hypothetical protein [sulfur-oxidizing endosymbiont of Gigantopelta aegis]|uniref:hypothetical protein n=1 Tax=sulfur-oxidizing endosymbiont of Gigantopelta aegis TaxID=2794934 RepID=UPI0018DCB942|nr:hypothetical protein [sulfur-oxidizing endosymbiont of Gigantopelta aegis]
MDWMKIFSALLIVMMLVYIVPRAKDMIKNSPKASSNDLVSVLIPLALVAGFVFLLIKSV